MTGIDTNILARFFTQDDPDQSRRADEFLQSLTVESPGYLSLVSLVELLWLLRSRYGTTKAQWIGYVKLLLSSSELVLESQAAVAQAVHRYASGKADFADCLIERACHLAGCRHTVTFDGGACKHAGMRLL